MIYDSLLSQLSPSINSKSSVLSAYQQQDFSIPNTIVNYVIKNVASPTTYQKLIMCCKYIFEKKFILCVHCLLYNGYDHTWECCLKFGKKSVTKLDGLSCWPNQKKFTFISQKLWVTNSLLIIGANDARILVFPDNLQFSIFKFHITNQIIYLDQIVLIGASVKKSYFANVTVIDRDQREVSLTNIIENLPLLEEFEFLRKLSTTHISKTTVDELLKCHKFSTLKYFSISNISEDFNITTFYNFLKENATMDVHLGFIHGLSENFHQKFDNVARKILELDNIWTPSLNIATENIFLWKAPLKDRHEEDSKKRFWRCFFLSWN